MGMQKHSVLLRRSRWLEQQSEAQSKTWLPSDLANKVIGGLQLSESQTAFEKFPKMSVTCDISYLPFRRSTVNESTVSMTSN
jgi:hypothetical protein